MRIHTWPLSEKVRAELFEAELISFDLFDTIAYRPGHPRAHFSLYGFFGSFIRYALEMVWRVMQKVGLVKDFKLNSLFSLFRAKIYQEFEDDLNQLLGRIEIIRLIQDLVQNEKQVVVLTNSYYSENQIRTICKKLDVPASIQVVVSSEFGVTKSKGLLHRAIKDIPLKHWHFGDDLKEDASVSLANFVLLNPIWNISPLLKSVSDLKIFRRKEILALRTVILKIALEKEVNSQDLFWFGVLFSGSTSVYVAQQVNAIANETSGDIFFLSRDGYLPYKYLEFDRRDSVFYIPYSRKISTSTEDLVRLVDWISKKSLSPKLFFDLGWRGESASRIVRMFGVDGRLILGGRWPWQRNKYEDYSILWKEHEIIKAFVFRSFPELYELALSAPHNSVTKLPDNLDNWVGGLDIDEDRQLIAAGAIAFQNEWRNAGDTPINSKVAFTIFNHSIKNPLLPMVAMLEGLTHDFKDERVPLVSNEKQPVVFWIRGSMLWQKVMRVPVQRRLTWAIQEIQRRFTPGFLESLKGFFRKLP